MSVYFHHSGYADHHVEQRAQNNRETHEIQEEHSNHQERLQRGIGAWLGTSVERVSVGPHTLQERRLDEAVADATELRCAQDKYRKTPERNNWTTY